MDYFPPAGWKEARPASCATIDLQEGARLTLGVSGLEVLRTYGVVWSDVLLDPGTSGARIDAVEHCLFDDENANLHHDAGERSFSARQDAAQKRERRTWIGFGGAEELAHPVLELRVKTSFGEHHAALPVASTSIGQVR